MKNERPAVLGPMSRYQGPLTEHSFVAQREQFPSEGQRKAVYDVLEQLRRDAVGHGQRLGDVERSRYGLLSKAFDSALSIICIPSDGAQYLVG